jgi:hypothetical protein
MRWNLVLVMGMGLLAFLAVLPESEQPTEDLREKYDRGFNEGYQCATRLALNAAESRHLGEYYYDIANQRHAFRWFCDEAEAARRREAASRSAAVSEPPPERVSQLSVDADLRDEFIPRRRAG